MINSCTLSSFVRHSSNLRKCLFLKLFCSVMQSEDGNSFCGDVVLGSFKKSSMLEGNILDQIYRSKYDRINLMMILVILMILTTVALKPLNL